MLNNVTNTRAAIDICLSHGLRAGKSSARVMANPLRTSNGTASKKMYCHGDVSWIRQ